MDETGIDGKPPFLIMAGVVVDAQRLTRTQVEFEKLFGDVSSYLTKALTFSGTGVWGRTPLHSTPHLNLVVPSS